MTDAPTPSPVTSAATRLSALLKAAGDELRLEVLRALAQDSFGVLELSRLFDTKQSGMSHHLKVLANASLVVTRKEGNSVFYRRATVSDGEYADLRNSILHAADDLVLRQETKENLQEIYRQRAEASRSFFSENSEAFKKQQDLIAAFDVYGSHVKDMLTKSNLPANEIALEIGPGAGDFLPVLCAHFKHVTALDNSAEMLKASQEKCRELGLENIDFVHNDTAYCRDIKNSVDCAVINMVLHHTPSPQQIFDDVAVALKRKGVVIVCDLAQHDQDWTREACGDLWLGFAAEDLSRWAKAHGLQEGQSVYFALRNGFQIQIREFSKH